MPLKKVAILMGSSSDYETVKPAEAALKKYGIEYETHVMSAHRTPELAAEFSKNAESKGFGVIIAAAGKAAHLAGAIAANTVLPVIGIPIKGSAFLGFDSLLSTVQMPAGIPVATVAVDGARNAAILAAQILAVGDAALSKALKDERAEMKNEIIKSDTLMSKK
ncbi:MAG: 5-(carboxyamino)imidazole ribonucleotide mutase [Clostridiaceae bacterium]|jgi:5-(carboxyamino)imidazole ribonucleotide mutase|nr:5-(carboxyamino)imidazole ribonucleotide mutase [Clostridiaceae bacterium]